MFPSLSTLALPLLLLSAPFAAASSSNHGIALSPIKRSHSRRALSAEQKRDAEIIGASRNASSVHSLDKRQSFSGRGTYYYVDVGPGACGNWGNNNDYTVALNSAQYCCGYPGPHCFQTITISANGVTVGGVRIMDECPTCGYGDLDLSPGLFERFAGFGAGVIQLSWSFDNGAPAPAPTTTPPPPPPSPTSEWVAPTSVWTPPPAPSPSPSTTTTWSAPPAPSSSTTTWQAPSSSSTSIWVAPSSSSLVPSSSLSASASSSAVNATVNPFAVISSANSSGTATGVVSGSAVSGSAVPSASGVAHTVVVAGNNIEAISGLVTNYGQIVVLGAGGRV